MERSESSKSKRDLPAVAIQSHSLLQMTNKIRYKFSAKVWQHAPPAGWYFVSLPESISIEIRKAFRSEEEGWGRLKATAEIGKSQWKTAIWFDTKRNTYLLPLKADIRKKESVVAGKVIRVTILL